MNQLNSLNRIAALLSRFVVEVKALNSINQFGINFLSETVLIPILRIVFELHELKNLNSAENNIAGIDLGDDNAKVAFQITSSSDNEKVKHTLRQFIKYEHYKKYNTLYLYIITEKQDSYFEKDYAEIIQGLIDFNAKTNILDFRDIMHRINQITDFEKVRYIEELLEKQFSEQKLERFKDRLEGQASENLISNLLEIKFPEKLYIADISIDRKEVLKLNPRLYKANDRAIIFEYKKQHDLRFSADWIDHNKQLITFHDLTNHNHDLSKVIDLGTVSSISPEEFYRISSAHLRAFKALLKYCFSKQVHFLNISYLHDENLYYFSLDEPTLIYRTESWNTGRRTISRDVVKSKLNKDKNGIWYYTHLAFRISFKIFDEKWYVEITPDWFISKNGVEKHFFQHESVTSFLKRSERNQHVFNHVKFLSNYFKYGKNQTQLFDSTDFRPKNFIQFLSLESFKNAPRLLESEWQSNESEESLKLMQDKDGEIEI